MLLCERRETEASTALREASALYEAWGAEAKASALSDARRQLTGEA